MNSLARSALTITGDIPTGGLSKRGKMVADTIGGMRTIDKASIVTSPVPVVGDVVGLTADISDYVQNPESRNIGNYMLSGVGLLPFVPSVSAVKKVVQNIKHFEKMGLTSNVKRAKAMLEDMVYQPLNMAEMAAKKGRTGLADDLITTAQDNMTAIRKAGVDVDSVLDTKIADVGMERGWWRGGEKPKKGRTGQWYTKDADEAADYARRSKSADVREYALPGAKSDYLLASDYYDPKIYTDLAELVEKDGHTKLANLMREYGKGDDLIPGYEVYKALESHISKGAPAEYLQKLGFKGIEGVNSPNYRQVFANAPVRDANLARFDKARLSEDNIFASVAPWLIGAGLSGRLVGSRGDNQYEK